MAFANNPYNEASFAKLLNQILVSGISAPLDNQNVDLRRIHEELLRLNYNLPGVEGRGGYRFGEDNRLPREQEGLRDRSYGDDIGNSGQDRSNFFGGALERKDRNLNASGPDLSMSQRGWVSGGGVGDLDDRRPDRMGMREGNRGSRYDGRGNDIGGSTLFNQPLDVMAANFISQNSSFPSSFGTTQNPLLSSNSTDLWPSMNDQGQGYNMYGMNSAFPLPYTVEPPPTSQAKAVYSEKPLGCHTIFIGGLADEITEDIIREIMCQCGAIESVRISKGKGDKKFCHLRFVDADSVELAVGYSGYKLFINNGDQRSGGRIHVDYAKSREDDMQYEKLLKAKEREARKDEIEKPLVLFTDSNATELMQGIRSSSGFQESFITLAQWLERGECTRKTSSTFYNLLSAVHSHIKRLLKEKKEHEEIVERQKREQAERATVITAQGAAILKIFTAASKKRCWDHFSKAQRRNIDEWHQEVEKEIKISEEEQMGNRQEVGMDLDEETDYTQTTYTSEPSQPEEDDSGEPKAKQMRTEDSSESTSETTQAAVEAQAQDLKLRAQNAGLKALAEKNASLMWQVEGYKEEILVLKQRFASVFQDKDLQIARLMTAVQGLQNFFQHVTLNAPQTPNVEVAVVNESNPTNDTEEQQTTDAESNSQELTSQGTTENKPNEKDEEKEGKEKEETPTDQEVTEVTEVTEEITSEEAVATDEDSSESTTKNPTAAEEIPAESMKNPTAAEEIPAESMKNPTAAEEIPAESMMEGESKEDNTPQSACHTEVVRLTSMDMTVVGILCSYLQICAYGATTEQVLAHIQRQVPGVSPEELQKVLDSLPMLFIGDGLEFCNKTWKFKQILK